jgi:hypothetical protein
MDLGCIEFCCVGPQAEQLHDSLDGIVEERGALEVVTTWHTDYSEACEYFLFAAGGKPPTLLALISSRPDLAALLEDETTDVTNTLRGSGPRDWAIGGDCGEEAGTNQAVSLVGRIDLFGSPERWLVLRRPGVETCSGSAKQRSL